MRGHGFTSILMAQPEGGLWQWQLTTRLWNRSPALLFELTRREEQAGARGQREWETAGSGSYL